MRPLFFGDIFFFFGQESLPYFAANIFCIAFASFQNVLFDSQLAADTSQFYALRLDPSSMIYSTMKDHLTTAFFCNIAMPVVRVDIWHILLFAYAFI